MLAHNVRVIFEYFRRHEKKDWQTKEEAARDRRVDRSVERGKPYPAVKEEMEAMSYESLHELHNFVEIRLNSEEKLLQFVQERADSTGWMELFEIAVKIPSVFAVIAASGGYFSGYTEDVGELTSIAAGGYISGFLAAYPLHKWMARMDVKSQEKKVEFLSALRVAVQEEWDHRGREYYA